MAYKKRLKKTGGVSVKRSGDKNLRKAILDAAAAAGKDFGDEGIVSYLQAQALSAPGAFLTLLGKILAEAEEQASPPVRRIELVAGAPSADPAGIHSAGEERTITAAAETAVKDMEQGAGAAAAALTEATEAVAKE